MRAFWFLSACGLLCLYGCMTPEQAKGVADTVQLDFMQRLAQMVVEGLITPETFTTISKAMAETVAKTKEGLDAAGNAWDWEAVGAELGKIGGAVLGSVVTVNAIRNRGTGLGLLGTLFGRRPVPPTAPTA